MGDTSSFTISPFGSSSYDLSTTTEDKSIRTLDVVAGYGQIAEVEWLWTAGAHMMYFGLYTADHTFATGSAKGGLSDVAGESCGYEKGSNEYVFHCGLQWVLVFDEENLLFADTGLCAGSHMMKHPRSRSRA